MRSYLATQVIQKGREKETRESWLAMFCVALKKYKLVWL